ncbi:MinD/ParA family protein [Pseudomonas benzenivorans]|uniref:MinD/ParA family protein n=1 Tax=Pseudomonas benzenivorans TaxID=556533 RepID=UPI00272B70E9|nr:MinD/ParA family protein [Pseudomonas benzenivorans]
MQVIAVTSGKGGVGKTNVAANLALALSDLGNRVVLLDADLANANLNVLLGHAAERSLAEVISGKSTLGEVVHEGRSGVQVVSGSSGDPAMDRLSPMQHAELIHAFSEIGDALDYLIIDTASGISDTVLNFVGAAREVLVVACDEPSSITSASTLIKLLGHKHGTTRFHVLASMTRSTQEGHFLFKKLVKISEQLPGALLSYAGAIPFDHFVRRAAQKSRTVYEAYPHSKSALAYQLLAQRIALWPFPDAPTGRLEFFVERLLAGSSEPVRRPHIYPVADCRRVVQQTSTWPDLDRARKFG